MNKKFGVVLAILFVGCASTALADSSDYDVQKHVDRIIEQSAGGPIEPAIPVTESAAPDRRMSTDAEVQAHIDRIIEQSAGGPIEPAISVVEAKSGDPRLQTASRIVRRTQ